MVAQPPDRPARPAAERNEGAIEHFDASHLAAAEARQPDEGPGIDFDDQASLGLGQKVEGPVLSEVEGPALSEVEGPALSEVEGAARNNFKPPKSA